MAIGDATQHSATTRTITTVGVRLSMQDAQHGNTATRHNGALHRYLVLSYVSQKRNELHTLLRMAGKKLGKRVIAFFLEAPYLQTD